MDLLASIGVDGHVDFRRKLGVRYAVHVDVHRQFAQASIDPPGAALADQPRQSLERRVEFAATGLPGHRLDVAGNLDEDELVFALATPTTFPNDLQVWGAGSKRRN